MTARPDSSGPTQSLAQDPSATRAIRQHRYGSPDVLALEHVPTPVPSADEVLVRVRAASVNARDWHIMRGEPRVARLMAPRIFGVRAPRGSVRGTDLAGVVEAVGPDATGWRPGDLVFGEGTGTFADHALARAGQLAPIPERVTFEQAAALPLAGTTALECLEAAESSPGMSILINGASGGVGTFAIQLARVLGLHVTAVVSPRNAAQAASLGAEVTIDYTGQDFTSTASSYDIVFDLVGNRHLDELRGIVRPDGAVILSGGGVSGQGRIIGPMRMLIQAQIQGRRKGARLLTPSPTPSTDTLRRLGEMVATGQVVPVIDRRFPLDQTAGAIEYMETTHTQGKVVVVP